MPQSGANEGEAGRLSPPYLFILGVDVLSRMLSFVYEGGFVQKVGPWNLGIIYLQYVDGTTMLLPPDLVSIRRVKLLIYMFELLSGLFINFPKLALYQIGPQAWMCLRSLAYFIAELEVFLSFTSVFPFSQPPFPKLTVKPFLVE